MPPSWDSMGSQISRRSSRAGAAAAPAACGSTRGRHRLTAWTIGGIGPRSTRTIGWSPRTTKATNLNSCRNSPLPWAGGVSLV